jgi:uncharacterized membrane protein
MKQISISNGLSICWKLLQRFAGVLAQAYIIIILVALVSRVISNVILKQQAHPNIGLSFIFALVTIAGIIVGIALDLGLTRIQLHIVTQSQARIKDLLVSSELIWKYFWAALMYGLIVLAGYLLFIIPGIIWSIKFSQFKYVMVEKGLGPIDALKESSRLTQGKKWWLFKFYFVLAFVELAGVLIFLVGALVTVPLASLTRVWVYRQLVDNN